jgi:glucose-1-phosphate cytidylyltransferase
MKCVILAGGLGTRLREKTEFIPKPLVKIGDKPIIWHLIKYYNYFGVKEFIICAGYKGEMLTKYFSQNLDLDNIKIQIVDTGEFSNTGERLRRIRQLVEGESFYCTYGDGLSNIDLNELKKVYETKNKIVTLCITHPVSRFGVIDIDDNNDVLCFREKPVLDSWINIGFYIFKSEIFQYIDQNSVLETDALNLLAEKREISAFKHLDFWQPMDTFRETKILNEMWDSGNPPWGKYLL